MSQNYDTKGKNIENLFEKVVDKHIFDWYNFIRTFVRFTLIEGERIKNMKATTKLKIVNKVRFTVSIIVALLIIMSVSVAIGAVVKAPSYVGDVGHSYKTVTVKSGDTVSAIAQAYLPQNMTVAQYTKEIIRLNSLESTAINPGDVIYLPYK